MTSDHPTLYVIDGHAQFFRAYYAIRTGMRSPVTNEPTSMTYGFMGMLLKLLRDHAPEYLTVAIDVSGDRESFRSELYPEYKANREAAPEDFHPQVERCLDLLHRMRVPVVGVEGVEADDVIATLVRRMRAEHPGVRVRIVSRDKDLAQLVDDDVELFDPYKDEPVDPAAIFKTEGVQPKHVRDILALMGDTVDNIPGVPGIGPKTAAKLVMQYGSIDNLYEHIDEIKGKRRENLEGARDTVALSRQLVELKDDVEFDLDLDAARFRPAALPVEELDEAFRELAFGTHAETLRSLVTGDAPAPADSPAVTAVARRAAPVDDFQPGLFGAEPSVAEVSAVDRGAYHAVTDAEALAGVIAEIRAVGSVVIDTETDSLSPRQAAMCGVSIAVRPEEAWYVPTMSPAPASHLSTTEVLEALRGVLEDPAITIIGHNLKFDLIVFRSHGVDVRGPMFDTMVASYVVDATRSSHKMDYLALALLSYTCIPIAEVLGRGRQQKTFDQVPLDQATIYAAEDADVTLRLRNVLSPRLEEMGLTELFEDVEMPLVDVLAELEYNGIRVDPDELGRQREILEQRTAALRRSIGEAAAFPFNPDSPKQLAQVLFNQPDQDPPGLGIKPLKKGKTGPSTDQEVLEKLAADPEIDSTVPTLILEYRQLTKLVNTYLGALVEAINPATGRVHASFNQTVAATGRLSSSDPNLQNIPIRTEVGREIRRAFVAEENNVLISADYSQIELRLLAHLADDPALIDAFHRGMDIHTAVAAEVFGVAPEAVTTDQRGTAKMVNFGIIYGVTPWGLARRLPDTSVEEATRIIEDYKQRFQRIDHFLAECVAQAMNNGWVETILKRRRAIPEIGARQPQRRALGERMAINTVVQGSAADLIKLAMIDLHGVLPARFPSTRMLLQIHDELVFEAPAAEAPAVQAFVVERMEAAMELKVPLQVDSACSQQWIDAK